MDDLIVLSSQLALSLSASACSPHPGSKQNVERCASGHGASSDFTVAQSLLQTGRTGFDSSVGCMCTTGKESASTGRRNSPFVEKIWSASGLPFHGLLSHHGSTYHSNHQAFSAKDFATHCERKLGSVCTDTAGPWLHLVLSKVLFCLPCCTYYILLILVHAYLLLVC